MSTQPVKRIQRRYILLEYHITETNTVIITAFSILSHVQRTVPNCTYTRVDKAPYGFSVLLIKDGKKMKIRYPTKCLTLPEGYVPKIIKVDRKEAYDICMDINRFPPLASTTPVHPFQCRHCRTAFNKISDRVAHEKDCNLK